MNNLKMNINTNELEDISCECGSKIFIKLSFFKYLSALQSPNGKEMALENLVTVCQHCGRNVSEAVKYTKENKSKSISALRN